METPTVQSVLTGASKTSQAGASLASDFDNFLTLLTTQLQNQDPLSPLESHEFTNQLVAFSGVEQQINTNQKLDDLLAFQLNSAATLGLGFIGKEVDVTGDTFKHEGGAKKFSYILPEDAKQVQISILDDQGQAIWSTAGQGDQLRAGKNEISWDGMDNQGFPVDSGTYTLSIGAIRDDDSSIPEITTLVPGLVEGFEIGLSGEPLLLVNGNKVPFSGITGARDPIDPVIATGGTGS